MLLNFLKRTAAALGLAGFCVGAAPVAVTAPPGPAHPALWEVSDPDTTIYLFGTIHLLPPKYSWENAPIERAIAKSDGLVVETIVDSQNPQEMAAAFQSLGFAPGLPPIVDRVSPAKRPLLLAAIAKSGLPPAAFDRMKTWAAAFTLLTLQYKAVGIGGEDGVEMTLRQQFSKAGKPVGQLETNAEQLGFFGVLPEEAQRMLLEGAVEKPEAMGKEFQTMLAAWSKGDVPAIAKVFNDDLSASPALLDALVKRRNAHWSQWIEKRLAAPGTVFVAVGAGHLAGPDSVQTLLEGRGLKVRRLQ
jgi:uncharacterized protein YbaP (TraB family)